jgi:tRNA threonylcarbamoyladenosine biosynthesis protein TsaB
VIILALESSTEQGSVALLQDGQVRTRHWLGQRSHAESLLQEVMALVNEAGIALAALDAIAFGQGPGSFTGLRTACGVAQGLALGADVPVVPVSTLLALAQATQQNRILSTLDARMGQLYLAAFERVEGQWCTRLEPLLCSPDQLPSLPQGKWLPTGSGFEVFEPLCENAWAGQLHPALRGQFPQASAVVELGAQAFAAGHAVAPELALPLYLRDKVAFTSVERQA